MARVIKGQKSGEAPKVVVAVPKAVGGGRVIERDVYRAQQIAREIMKNGESEKKRRLAEGKRLAALTTEEAMVKGATEAFAQVAQEAIIIFANKANQYADVESDIRLLAQEIVQKILGADLQLNEQEVNALVKSGINKLRARRRLKLQFSKGRLSQLKSDQTMVFDKVTAEPDFDIEEVSDVNVGFVRVVSDVGSALCNESVAIKTLSQVFSGEGRA